MIILKDIENLKNMTTLKKTGNNVHITDLEGNKIQIVLKNINIPFGLEKYNYNKQTKYYLKLNINDSISNKINNLEKYIKQRIYKEFNIDLDIKTQIITKSKFNNQLITKFKDYYNKIQTKVFDKENKNITIFEILPKKKIDIYISPNCYISNKNIILKWTIITIKLLR
jgi:hypothetical protein